MRKGQTSLQTVKNESMQGVGRAAWTDTLRKINVPRFTVIRFPRYKTFNVFFFTQEKQLIISNPEQLEVIYE